MSFTVYLMTEGQGQITREALECSLTTYFFSQKYTKDNFQILHILNHCRSSALITPFVLMRVSLNGWTISPKNR